VAALLAATSALGLVVVARGAGTTLSWGAPPHRVDVVVDTTALRGIVEHTAGDLVVVVGAGTRLIDLQDALRPSGQRLALDGEHGPATVGGLLALGLSGRSSDGEAATIHGRYLPQAGTLDLDVTAQNGAAKHWGGYLIRLSQVRWEGGRFDGRVHILATPSRDGLIMDYTASLRLTDAEAVYLPTHLWLQHLSGMITLDTDQASTSGLTLTANGSSLWLRGDVAYPGEVWVDLAISSPGLDFSTVRALFFPTARLGLVGRASGDVWITGPASAPYIDGDVSSASGRLNRQAFDALHTRFQYSGGTLALNDLGVRVAGGQIIGSAVVDVSGQDPSYMFSAAAQNLDASVLPAAGLPVTGGLIGRATGEVVGVGSGGRVQLMARAAVGPGSVRGQPFHDLHALFWDDNGTVDLDFLRATVGATTVYASGQISRRGALDLAVTALDLPLGQLGALVSTGGSQLAGTANFAGGRIADAPTNHALVKNYSVVGLHWGLYQTKDPQLIRDCHVQLTKLVADGQIRPLIGERLGLTDVADGIQRLADGSTVGRLVFVP